MPTIKNIIDEIELVAPRQYQEGYDNARLITGNKNEQCTGVLISLDCVETIVEEAIAKNCNLIVAHHPIVFKGLKSLTGANYVERTIIKAIKHDVAIYAAHTNLDNILTGVNAKICEKLGLQNLEILAPKQNTLLHLITFVPKEQAAEVTKAMHNAGAGNIGNYKECSFQLEGKGTFLPTGHANPTKGELNQLQVEDETRVEVMLPIHLQQQVISALKQAHPYEEVAYYLSEIVNENQEIGSGMIGELPTAVDEEQFLQHVKSTMNTNCIRHTKLLGKPIQKVAVCGGAGSFLLPVAIAKQADIYISADFKYHEFFDADGQLVIADIGHFESEQFTNEIFKTIINKKFSTFAVHFAETNTNPINYI